MSDTNDTPPLLERTRAIEDKVDQLRELLRERAQQESVQQKAFDQLYEELRQYKDDFIFQAEKPFLLDLLLFYDSLNWFQQSLQRREMSMEVIGDSFQYLVDEFLELLYRRDVLPCETAEKFDRKLHKAVKIVPTTDPAEDWTVNAVLKRGFVRGERVLRAEEVAVYRVGSDPESSKS